MKTSGKERFWERKSPPFWSSPLAGLPRIKSNFLSLKGKRQPNHLVWDTREQNLGFFLASPPGQQEGNSLWEATAPSNTAVRETE